MRRSLRRLLALLGCLLGCVFAFGTPADTLIRNVASVTYAENGVTETVRSDEVETRVRSICSLSVLPDGTLDTPAQRAEVAPGGEVYLPYSLTNTGNDRHRFDLAAQLLPASEAGANLSLVHDLDGDLQAGGDEPEVTALELAADETAQLLLRVAPDAEAEARLWVNVAASCADVSDAQNPDTQDSDNVSQIDVLPPFGGAGGQPLKSAEPASGSVVYPGASIRYTISFELANAQTDLTVTDVLSPLLEAPADISSGSIRDAESGLEAEAEANYDPETRALTWRFAEVPAGMQVALSFTARVRGDLDIAPGTVLPNEATVAAAGLPPTVTNAVSHDLRPVTIDLDKRARQRRVSPGGIIDYELEVSSSPANPPFERLSLSDVLPEGLDYLPDSSSLLLPDGTTTALEPDIQNGTLVWTLPPLNPGETLLLAFRARVKVSASLAGELVNRAEVLAEDDAGRAVAEDAASVSTQVAPGALTAPPVLLGTVFEDHDGDGLYDHGVGRPLPGVRLYLSDGSSVVSDDLGRYTFLELKPGVAALRVDGLTLPPRYLQETLTETKMGLWRLRLRGGVITRQDVPFEPARVRLAVRQQLRLESGPVALTKSARVLPGGDIQIRFDLTSNESLSRLYLEDALPAGAEALTGLRPVGEPSGPSAAALTLDGVPAGFQAAYVYEVAYSGVSAELLLLPELRWEP